MSTSPPNVEGTGQKSRSQSPKSNPTPPGETVAIRKVLDVGTGTDFADEFPNAEIIGTDLSPIQPTWIPPNIKFELEDATGTWSWPENTFDFVHLRYLFGAIADWNALFAEAYRTCKPGGWVQSCEIDPPFYSDDGTVDDNAAMQTWNTVAREGGIRFGRTFCVVDEGLQVPGLEAAGFVDIQQQNFKVRAIPGNFSSQQMSNLEFRFLLAAGPETPSFSKLASFSGYTMILWHQVMGWPKDEYQVFLMGMRKALRDKRIHSYMNLRYVWARKPEEATEA
ncbi:hypothetical protein N0V84_000206 [Fusarium piperis]|uniref:Methyltransferase n=1 Tax=Fusarium piperis TaxID=1435070 RepID=A0A9W8WNR6_9HYPO|nr:hypothetical protein N0V84_000206 [Fusarium piperis]